MSSQGKLEYVRHGIARFIFSKEDLVFLTRCKIKGHVVKKSVLDGIRGKENDKWTETACEKCNYPVYVCTDPEDANFYIISEDE